MLIKAKERYARKRVAYLERARQYRLSNLDRFRANKKKSYQKNAEYYRTYAKAYRKNNKEKIRESRLIKCYQLTQLDYTNMITSQEGACRICKRKDRKLVIDHDHKTGEVRALLCNKCNTLLGVGEDNVEILYSAITYLRNGTKGMGQ